MAVLRDVAIDEPQNNSSDRPGGWGLSVHAAMAEIDGLTRLRIFLRPDGSVWDRI